MLHVLVQPDLSREFQASQGHSPKSPGEVRQLTGVSEHSLVPLRVEHEDWKTGKQDHLGTVTGTVAWTTALLDSTKLGLKSTVIGWFSWRPSPWQLTG